jgi:hypothetical protein
LTSSPSNKLLQRFRRLVDHKLLQVVPPIPGIQLGPGEIRVQGIVPRIAISLAFAFEDDAVEDEFAEELQAIGLETMPANVLAKALALANAYYYNERANNIRHESKCYHHDQPWCGWRVCTLTDHLACECNFFNKKKFCCHLLYALQIEKKDYKGVPLPPTTFEPNRTHRRGEAAPRFPGRRRGAQSSGRNVRARRTVGDPLALQ